MKPQELMRRLKKSQLSMVEKLTEDNPELDPSEGSVFCTLEIPTGPSGMRQYLRIMKLKGISFNWKKQ